MDSRMKGWPFKIAIALSRLDPNPQIRSPLFKLPTEVRLSIYRQAISLPDGFGNLIATLDVHVPRPDQASREAMKKYRNFMPEVEAELHQLSKNSLALTGTCWQAYLEVLGILLDQYGLHFNTISHVLQLRHIPLAKPRLLPVALRNLRRLEIDTDLPPELTVGICKTSVFSSPSLHRD